MVDLITRETKPQRDALNTLPLHTLLPKTTKTYPCECQNSSPTSRRTLYNHTNTTSFPTSPPL